MCRLVGYLGNTIPLDELLYKQEHSLYNQSYNPVELKSGVVCADGSGVGWYDKEGKPFIYRNTIPIWNDPNLEELSHYVQSTCALGYVRLAGTGESLDISNCQPFRSDKLLFVHNGEITNFQQTLARPIRDSLSDSTYRLIKGMTDSEHIFALLVEMWQLSPGSTLLSALRATLEKLTVLAKKYDTSFSANIIVSDGQALAATRYAYGTQAPTLYWSCDDAKPPTQVIVASEPLSNQNWTAFPDQSTLFVQSESLQPTTSLIMSELPYF
ncbi:ergothioneine biosynthesis protein EgtC [Brasilonema bromeliae]|uniref:Ergothioneine biosynthesis protein EgtC n=1 Tax=Brasilonema bromeliae SPC951 TaxID=385972 RepID=A0ABX1P9C0_9CYAN|nr:ergothioneine biosynthesis protein EgtC [Brasilonema bromeliae]NMG21027.1 ergothioneine biosynthesis protein EgtC [Brasilonema bromeliae SPC951]